MYVDEVVRADFFLIVSLPEGTELGPHVATLMIRVFMARRHLLQRVNVHVNVSRWIGGGEDLTVRQHNTPCGVLCADRAHRFLYSPQCTFINHTNYNLEGLVLWDPSFNANLSDKETKL